LAKTSLILGPLGGGGARGLAHIGVLKVLEKNHLPISFVVDTSMGAFVGGFYAAGTGIELTEELALSAGGLYRLFGCLPFGPFNKWVAVSATVRPNRLQPFRSF